MKGDQVVRMTPYKDGQANHGHSCVKGRFAWGYASHRDRVMHPMIRENTTDPGARSAGKRRSAMRPAASRIFRNNTVANRSAG